MAASSGREPKSTKGRRVCVRGGRSVATGGAGSGGGGVSLRESWRIGRRARLSRGVDGGADCADADIAVGAALASCADGDGRFDLEPDRHTSRLISDLAPELRRARAEVLPAFSQKSER